MMVQCFFFFLSKPTFMYTLSSVAGNSFLLLLFTHMFFYSMVFLSLIFVFIKFIIVCWVYSFFYLTFFLSRIFHDLCIGLYVVCLNSVYLFHTFAFTYSVFITLFTYIKSFFSSAFQMWLYSLGVCVKSMFLSSLVVSRKLSDIVLQLTRKDTSLRCSLLTLLNVSSIPK